MASPSLRRELARQLLKHREFFDNEFRPMAQGLSAPAFEACHVVAHPGLRNALLGAGSSSVAGGIPSMRQLIRQPYVDEVVGVEALKALVHAKSRVEATAHKSLIHVPYSLNVGDVVRHSQFGHLGVIAARLPVCFESDDWVLENLGSLDDRRLQHPWYLVLVSSHMGLPPHFVRFGSQLTHHKVDECQGIGYHNMLPTFFKGFDHAAGRYLPRFETDALAGLSTVPVGGCSPPVAARQSDGPACKLPSKRRSATATK